MQDIAELMRSYGEAAREAARRPPRTIAPYLTRNQLDAEKRRMPAMADWLEENTVIVENMSSERYELKERLNERHGSKKEPPVLNRADRRHLRNRKTR